MSTTTATPPVSTSTSYASFGARLGALLIDYVIICIVQFLVVAPIMAMLGMGMASQVDSSGNISEEQALGMAAAIVTAVSSALIFIYAIAILYFSIMESSKLQGSVGKLAVGIKVTDLNGDRISFGKALLRSFGKIISGFILYIGYIMAAFTEKKQGLHDMIASTLVLKK